MLQNEQAVVALALVAPRCLVFRNGRRANCFRGSTASLAASIRQACHTCSGAPGARWKPLEPRELADGLGGQEWAGWALVGQL